MPQEPSLAKGVLELGSKGFGYLRDPGRNYAIQASDPQVPSALCHRHGLRPGSLVSGRLDGKRRGPHPQLVAVDTVEGIDAATFRAANFDSLTPIDPHEWLRLETGPEPLTTRVMDLL